MNSRVVDRLQFHDGHHGEDGLEQGRTRGYGEILGSGVTPTHVVTVLLVGMVYIFYPASSLQTGHTAGAETSPSLHSREKKAPTWESGLAGSVQL